MLLRGCNTGGKVKMSQINRLENRNKEIESLKKMIVD